MLWFIIKKKEVEGICNNTAVSLLQRYGLDDVCARENWTKFSFWHCVLHSFTLSFKNTEYFESLEKLWGRKYTFFLESCHIDLCFFALKICCLLFSLKNLDLLPLGLIGKIFYVTCVKSNHNIRCILNISEILQEKSGKMCSIN